MIQNPKQSVVSRYQPHLTLDIYEKRATYCKLAALVAPTTLQAFYNHAIITQRSLIPTQGIHKRDIPNGYVEKNFKHDLIEHLKEFILKYLILGYINEEIRIKKLPIAGEPRLMDIVIDMPNKAEYHFELTLYPQIPFHEWKYLPFNPAKRKNYKDLDRQVESFLEQEAQLREKTSDTIKINDWVNFSLAVVTADQKPLLENFTCRYWLKIGDEEADRPLQELFVGKKINSIFCESGAYFQYYFNEPLASSYQFCINIHNTVPHQSFSIEQFKHHFRLKSNKEVTDKMIEVFSYRNDVSLRRSIAEDALNLLISKHALEIPHYLMLRQKKALLETVSNIPDYHVYRAQKDFDEKINQLAEKQAREQIFLDQLACYENIVVNTNDIKSYLNLTKRPRTKDFLYFDALQTKVKGQEFPFIEESLKRVCLREKTLNFVIYHLTKKD